MSGPADIAALAAEAVEAPEAWLEEVLDAVPTPLVLVEAGSARVLFANTAARSLAGGELPPLPLRRAAAGEDLRNVVLDWDRPGGSRALLVSTDRLPARPGRPAISVVTFEDVTEVRGAERTSDFLARTGEALGASLEIDRNLEALAELTVPDRADWCAIDVRDLGGDLRRVAARGPAPDRIAGLDGVLRSGGPVLRDDAIIVPLRVRGHVIGAISVALTKAGNRYGRDDLALFGEVAHRASTAIENAGLHDQMRYIARTLQTSLLPPGMPEVPGFELAARYRAAGEGIDAGGDFYDVFRVGEGAWAFVLGDVVGKGPPAAALTAMARYTTRAAALEHPEPSRALTLLNDALLREDAPDRIMSAVHGRLVLGDPPVVTFAGAGHPPPLLARGGRVEAVGVGGRLLGVVGDPLVEDHSIALEPGDTIVLYTDGLTDAGAPARLMTIEELMRALEDVADRSAEEIAGHLEDVAVRAGQGSPRDDLAVIVLRYVG